MDAKRNSGPEAKPTTLTSLFTSSFAFIASPPPNDTDFILQQQSDRIAMQLVPEAKPTTLTSLFTSSFAFIAPAPPNDTDFILQQLSDRRAIQLIPMFVFLAVVFVTGLVGNSLIVYIYWTKFKATWSRTAIVALGIFDLISCLLAAPGEAVDLRFSFNYHSDVMCRLSRAAATFPSIASGIMLTGVAFDRYRLICSPLRSPASRRSARRHVLVTCVLSLLTTWPAAVVYGVMTTNATGVDGVTGEECSTSDLVKGTKIHLAYSLLLCLVFLTTFVTMIVCYTLIGRQIYRQGEFRKTLMYMRDRKRRNTHSELELDASLASDPDAGRDLSHGDSSEHYNNNSHSVSTATAGGNGDNNKPSKGRKVSNGSAAPESSSQNQDNHHNHLHHHHHSLSRPSSPTKSPTSPPVLRRQPSRTTRILRRLKSNDSAGARTRKTTVMLCFISVVFVLSFLPHLVVKLVRTLDKGFLHEPSTARLVVYNLCARSYFLNSFANVFIYGFCSFRFRRECVKVLRRMMIWKACRCRR